MCWAPLNAIKHKPSLQTKTDRLGIRTTCSSGSICLPVDGCASIMEKKSAIILEQNGHHYHISKM